jgi:cytoskeletal protein RodZ
MSSRLSIFAGLVVGIAVAALVLGAIVAFAPDPVPALQPTPSLEVVPSASASARASASASPSESSSSSASPSKRPAASGSAKAAGSLVAAASASAPAGSAGTTAFDVGERARPLVVSHVTALGAIGADLMVQGLSSVMPGVNVTP